MRRALHALAAIGSRGAVRALRADRLQAAADD